MPAAAPAPSWRDARPGVEPQWDRTRDAENTLCARCVLLMMLPHCAAAVSTPEGTFPIMASGQEMIRDARAGAGDGHQVLLDGSPFGVFADTVLDGEAACWNHTQYVARTKGLAFYL